MLSKISADSFEFGFFVPVPSVSSGRFDKSPRQRRESEKDSSFWPGRSWGSLSLGEVGGGADTITSSLTTPDERPTSDRQIASPFFSPSFLPEHSSDYTAFNDLNEFGAGGEKSRVLYRHGGRGQKIFFAHNAKTPMLLGSFCPRHSLFYFGYY